MEHTFGNYTIKTSGEITTLQYARNAKDWFDILFHTVGGLGSLVIVYFILTKLSSNNPLWITIIVLLLFMISACYKLWIVILRFRSSSNKVLKIDKNNGSRFIKRSRSKRDELIFPDLKVIEYKLHSEDVNVDNNFKTVFWIEVEIVTTARESIPMFTINPIGILDKETHKKEKELFDIAEPLCKKLAGELGIKSKKKKW